METVVVTASAPHGLGLSTLAWAGMGVLLLVVIAWQARMRLGRHRS
ncbi:MAG TPA: hypothetical protein VME21_13285 [Steroidobacteraceae bacterium]|nr:hypothetical protein [Steroidobacteraceae bacterium]